MNNKYYNKNNILIFFNILLLCALLLSIIIISINHIIIVYRKTHESKHIPKNNINIERFADINNYISSILVYTNNITNSSWIDDVLK